MMRTRASEHLVSIAERDLGALLVGEEHESGAVIREQTVVATGPGLQLRANRVGAGMLLPGRSS